MKNDKTSKLDEESRIVTLPDEIAMIIFLRVKTKSLFRCKSVCKLWRDTINSRSFSDLHRSSFAHRESQLVLVKFPSKNRRTLEFYAINVEFSTNTVTVSQLPILKFPSVSFTCHLGHGLTLVKGTQRYFLYNPVRGEKLILPWSTIDEVDDKYKTCVYGLGFDNSNKKQYKLVRVALVLPRKNPWEEDDNVTEIYTLGSNKWRKITAVSPYSPSTLFKPGTSAYGDVHWIVKIKKIRVGVTFDITKEEFKIVPLPNANTLLSALFMFNWREELAILECSTSIRPPRNIAIWVLKDYENTVWEKKYTLNLFPPFHNCNRFATWVDGFVFRVNDVPCYLKDKRIDPNTYKLLYWDTEKDEITTTTDPFLSELLQGRSEYEIFETCTHNLDSLAMYAN